MFEMVVRRPCPHCDRACYYIDDRSVECACRGIDDEWPQIVQPFQLSIIIPVGGEIGVVQMCRSALWKSLESSFKVFKAARFGVDLPSWKGNIMH